MDIHAFEAFSPASSDPRPKFNKYRESISFALTDAVSELYIGCMNSTHVLPLRFTRGFQEYFQSMHGVSLCSLLGTGSNGLPKDRCMFPGCSCFLQKMGEVKPDKMGLTVELSQHLNAVEMIPAFHKAIEAVSSEHSKVGQKAKVDLITAKVESAECLLPPLSLRNHVPIASLDKESKERISKSIEVLAVQHQKESYRATLERMSKGNAKYLKTLVATMLGLELHMSYRCLEAELLRVLQTEGVPVPSQRASGLLSRCEWSGRYVVVRG